MEFRILTGLPVLHIYIYIPTWAASIACTIYIYIYIYIYIPTWAASIRTLLLCKSRTVLARLGDTDDATVASQSLCRVVVHRHRHSLTKPFTNSAHITNLHDD